MKEGPEKFQFIENITGTNRFFFLGLGTTAAMERLLFVIFFIIYVITIVGNVMITVIIRLNSHLHKPMYFFLVNLSLIDILYTTTTTPNTLRNFLREDKTISFVGCFLQMFFFIGFGGSECGILAVMAFDRYVAICRPLFYSTQMNYSFCACVTVIAWMVGFTNSLIHCILAAMLPFCDNRKIDHFFCDIPPVLKLSCRSTQMNEFMALLFGGFVMTSPLLLTFISYACILRAVLSMTSVSLRLKTFSTCGSHLVVVTLFLGALVLTYFHPNSKASSEQDKVLALIYGIITPLVNPMIYSFKNKDIQKAFRRIIRYGHIFTEP